MEEKSKQIDQVSLMFETARSFLAGAKIVIDSAGIEDAGQVRKPTLPVITCAAMAIELQLKALLWAHGIERPAGDGHDLKRLFEVLPGDLQMNVLAFQEQLTRHTPEEARQALFGDKDVFKVWRYPYERRELECGPAFLVDFAIALSEFLLRDYPIERSDNGWLKPGRDKPFVADDPARSGPVG